MKNKNDVLVKCDKHGETHNWVSFDFGTEIDGYYCLVCLAEELIKKFKFKKLDVTKIEKKGLGKKIKEVFKNEKRRTFKLQV